MPGAVPGTGTAGTQGFDLHNQGGWARASGSFARVSGRCLWCGNSSFSAMEPARRLYVFSWVVARPSGYGG